MAMNSDDRMFLRLALASNIKALIGTLWEIAGMAFLLIGLVLAETSFLPEWELSGVGYSLATVFALVGGFACFFRYRSVWKSLEFVEGRLEKRADDDFDSAPL